MQEHVNGVVVDKALNVKKVEAANGMKVPNHLLLRQN